MSDRREFENIITGDAGPVKWRPDPLNIILIFPLRYYNCTVGNSWRHKVNRKTFHQQNTKLFVT